MLPAEQPGRLSRLKNAVPAILGLLLFVAALEVLRSELRAVTWHDLNRDVLATSSRQLLLALLVTAANYALLTAYDFLALAYVGKRLPWGRVALTSFLAYAIANNVGFSMLSGASVRYRFYTRLGVTPEELARIVFSYSVTFWTGLLLLGGLSLVSSPLTAALDLPLRRLVLPLGFASMVASLGYVALTFFRREPLRLRRFELPLPASRVAVAQLFVSVVDWLLAATVLYLLLPAGKLPFLGLLGAFLAAQVLGLVSHVPGGVGVFEGLMVLLLKPFLTSAELLPALVVYRGVYYLIPLAVALVMLVADELHQRREQVARAGAALARVTEQLTPRALSAFTFLSGCILLLSGATPAAAGRLAMLHRLLPLGVIETSHFLGSLVGAALLVLSQGLARRLDAAYFLSMGAILVGILASLLKGADYEEATFLTLTLLVLWRARPAFGRRAALLDTRFSPRWILAIACVMTASVWLGMFAFQHVEYSNDLWWQFELRGEASRFLRASVGAAVALALFGLGRLIRPAPHEADAPTDFDLEAAGRIIATQTSTIPYLVYLRDKAMLFDEGRTGFVMYGVQGRTWVALGDPVAPAAEASDLIRIFLERCDDLGGTPVFYEVGKDRLYRYADFGLTFLKLGEEATVDLERFTLEGSRGSRNRQALRRLAKQEATFRVVPKENVPAIMEALREVSEDWLEKKAVAEKGFSLGFFDAEYLSRFPVAIIERSGRVVGFANLWPGPQNVELSVDMMRYHHQSPHDVMDGLFVHLMEWGKAQGYQRFSLGVAPFSGVERSEVAPLWNRLGSFLFEHGGQFYNFQGLRAYKDKFDPQWEPRYLVYPGGLRLPRILADVAALVAGGYRKILMK